MLYKKTITISESNDVQIKWKCDDGIQYGIQACGDEAIELHKEALKYYKQ